MSAASRQREAARRLNAAVLARRPRNVTVTERRCGQPALSATEWDALRGWQADQRDRLCGPWLPVFPPLPPRRLMAGERLVPPRVVTDSTLDHCPMLPILLYPDPS
jgi:hypothetical protein